MMLLRHKALDLLVDLVMLDRRAKLPSKGRELIEGLKGFVIGDDEVDDVKCEPEDDFIDDAVKGSVEDDPEKKVNVVNTDDLHRLKPLRAREVSPLGQIGPLENVDILTDASTGSYSRTCVLRVDGDSSEGVSAICRSGRTLSVRINDPSFGLIYRKFQVNKFHPDWITLLSSGLTYNVVV